MTFYQIVFLFFAYSFLGWVGEVLFTAVVHRKYQDRGVLSGPLCLLYGVGGLVITFALGDIREGWFFLLVFSAVYATVIEWIGGHILEYTTHTRWWDYSAMPFNLDGYVCLGASLTWGALGVVVLKWGNPLLLALYSLVPRGIWVVVLLAALVVFCVDLVGTLLAMRLLVVLASPPESSFSYTFCAVRNRRIAPQPPGPGLPLQAPSV